MGHQRLGRLKHNLRWREVLQLLQDQPSNAAAVASRSVLAVDDSLLSLNEDPSLNHCFWLLTRLTWAARDADFPKSIPFELHVALT